MPFLGNAISGLGQEVRSQRPVLGPDGSATNTTRTPLNIEHMPQIGLSIIQTAGAGSAQVRVLVDRNGSWFTHDIITLPPVINTTTTIVNYPTVVASQMAFQLTGANGAAVDEEVVAIFAGATAYGARSAGNLTIRPDFG